MNLPRLEQHVTKFYAEHIMDYIADEEFKLLVKDSAMSVINRQETDTVIFVDDLRWWLGKLHGFDGDEDVGIAVSGGGASGVAVFPGQNVDVRRREYRMKMNLVDNVLAELGIDA
jgi:ankyrin repeat/BTB/POZ domain-containing protein 1